MTGFVVAWRTRRWRRERAASLDRHAVRATFERRFSATVMARNYVGLYRQLADTAGVPASKPLVGPAAHGRCRRSCLCPMTIEPADTGEPRVPRLFALKHGDTFVVADAFGDILGDGDGLFRGDTRSCPASA